MVGVMVMVYTAEEIHRKFQAHCPGTLEEYTALMGATYVRSQVQLALANYGGAGHAYNSQDALDVFPVATLLRVIREGSAPLIPNAQEPSATLRQRREDLNIPPAVLARRTGLTEADIIKAETPGTVTPVRHLEKIAQYLGLDDRQIGVVPASGGDPGLGVRLRELAGGDARRFTPDVVLALSEAAWVVSRQQSLSRRLGHQPHRILSEAKSDNYNYPNWERGYELAERTRHKLGMYHDEPIESLRVLIEDVIGIPLIQMQLPQQFAGATISNGADRGIVVNERGQNENVCVRRMTMCHELGHLLWDPNEKLNTLTVDEYSTIDNISYTAPYDVAEIRANAFAVAFLAPRDAIRKIADQENDLAQTIRRVAEEFRVSATAAKHHVCNVLGQNHDRAANVRVPGPLQEWLAPENLSIDFFPLGSTPLSRRGRFARLVSQAWNDGLVSTDSAALLLQCAPEEVEDATVAILDRVPLPAVN